MISAVKELQKISSQELNKLLRESENLTVHFHTENGSTIKVEDGFDHLYTTNSQILVQIIYIALNFQVDMEKFVGFLPLHLMAVLMSVEKDQALFRYLLSGLRLLHSLCDLASRNNKIEQVIF